MVWNEWDLPDNWQSGWQSSSIQSSRFSLLEKYLCSSLFADAVGGQAH
jgi:hypothetical protein